MDICKSKKKKHRFPSYEKLTLNDLENLSNRVKEHIFYKNDFLCIVLVQGAAEHFLYGKRGIKDFDVAFFYKEKWHQRSKAIDSGPKFAKFGIHPKSKERKKSGFKFRWIDLLHRKIGRKIVNKHKGDIRAMLKDYFETKPTKTALCWSKRPVIGLFPENLRGELLWIPKQD